MGSLKFTIFYCENDTVPIVLWGRDLQRPRQRQREGRVGANSAALRSGAQRATVHLPAHLWLVSWAQVEIPHGCVLVSSAASHASWGSWNEPSTQSCAISSSFPENQMLPLVGPPYLFL